MSEKPIPVRDLGTMHRVYSEMGRSPEVTAQLPKPRKGQPSVPAIGDVVTIASPTTSSLCKPDSECEAEVIGVAVVLRPLWDTMRHPWDAEQQRLGEGRA